MHFLVTGAAGFLGSHLVHHLRAQGYSVTGIDVRPGADVQADLLTVDLEPLVAKAEYVIHLAGQPGVRESWNQFAAYSRGNIETTQRLLEALRQRPPRKFVLASTSSVYGQAPMPAREDGPTLPISPYGVTKLAAESLCHLYERIAAIPWVALRYFTVYGPGQRQDMAFARWLRAARAGTPIRLFGSGAQIRDFTYVGDAVEATTRAALAPVCSVPINVGGGRGIPVRTALDLISQITGAPLQIEHLPPAPGDMAQTEAETSRLRNLVGYLPSTPLLDGLRLQYAALVGGEPS